MSDGANSPDQNRAINAAVAWYRQPTANTRPFRLEGAAGTGKTRCVEQIVTACGAGRVAYVAPTGKAASVLRARNCDGATTVHSAIYRPAGERTAQLHALRMELAATPMHKVERRAALEAQIEQVKAQPRWTLREPGKAFGGTRPRLVVLDEASMVDDRMFAHLTSFEIPIIALGDPHQLPPVGGTANWMRGPADATLTTIHRCGDRQPLIDLATALRNGRRAPAWDGTAGMTARPWSPGQLHGYDQIVVGRKVTRWKLIDAIRRAAGRPDGTPVSGDRVMVTRNNPDHDVVNGQQAVVDHVHLMPDLGAVALDVTTDTGERATWLVDERGFHGQDGQDEAKRDRDSDLIAATFAQAVTCHSAQGSQWARVAVVDEASSFPSSARSWRYTASTRAEKACLLLDPRRMVAA